MELGQDHTYAGMVNRRSVSPNDGAKLRLPAGKELVKDVLEHGVPQNKKSKSQLEAEARVANQNRSAPISNKHHDQIREAVANGAPQAQVAKEWGVSRQMINQILRRTSN